MSATSGDLFKLIGFVQDDLRGCQGKLVTLRAMLANLNLPESRSPHICPESHCGLDLRTEGKLADHLANVHGKAVV